MSHSGEHLCPQTEALGTQGWVTEGKKGSGSKWVLRNSFMPTNPFPDTVFFFFFLRNYLGMTGGLEWKDKKGSGLTDKSEHLIHRRDVQRKLSKVVIFLLLYPVLIKQQRPWLQTQWRVIPVISPFILLTPSTLSRAPVSAGKWTVGVSLTHSYQPQSLSMDLQCQHIYLQIVITHPYKMS